MYTTQFTNQTIKSIIYSYSTNPHIHHSLHINFHPNFPGLTINLYQVQYFSIVWCIYIIGAWLVHPMTQVFCYKKLTCIETYFSYFKSIFRTIVAHLKYQLKYYINLRLGHWFFFSFARYICIQIRLEIKLYQSTICQAHELVVVQCTSSSN